METAYFLSLPRDDARDLFGRKTDTEVLAFCRDALAREDIDQCELGARWQELKQALADYAATLNDDAAEGVLLQAVAGGRPLYNGDECMVLLVRPDVAAYAAQLLEGYCQSLSVDEPLKALAAKVQSLFALSASERKAVVFFAI